MFEDVFKEYMKAELHNTILKYNHLVDRMNEIKSLCSKSGITELDGQISFRESELMDLKKEICDQAILIGLDPQLIILHSLSEKSLS